MLWNEAPAINQNYIIILFPKWISIVNKSVKASVPLDLNQSYLSPFYHPPIFCPLSFVYFHSCSQFQCSVRSRLRLPRENIHTEQGVIWSNQYCTSSKNQNVSNCQENEGKIKHREDYLTHWSMASWIPVLHWSHDMYFHSSP